MKNYKQLEKDLGSEILKTLNDNDIKFAGDPNNFDEILLTYVSVIVKLIPSKPRTVLISNELNEKLKDNTYPTDKKDSINKIIENLKNGKDINGCLSKTYINNPLASDKLLDDWGIHHLHLSGCDKDFFDLNRKMTEDLLMAIILNDKAYLIDVTDHDPNIWYNENFIEIILNNKWEKEIFSQIYESKETPLDVKEARKENLNQLGYHHNGKIYVPKNYGAFTCGGNSGKAINAKIDIVKQIFYGEFEYDRMEFYPFCTNVICKVFDKNNNEFVILI